MSKLFNAPIDSCLRAIAELATHPSIRFVALFCLCSVYVVTGIEKLIDIPKAINEVKSFGVPMPAAATITTIVVELGGSALVISGWRRWLGALLLALFTFIVNFVANRFWHDAALHRDLVEDAFLEHVGLVAAFLLVAWYDAKLLSMRAVPSASGIAVTIHSTSP
ncbi:DoxX family protein [Dyella sp. 20L07]|uniref:DoxX family protein n=1 Tax=Dyella sp. 20L07 TaxID=3384240 RepID=UPI003D2E1FCD